MEVHQYRVGQVYTMIVKRSVLSNFRITLL